MSDTSGDRARLLGFAQQVGNPDTPPEDTARTRGWLDASGEITEDGEDVLKSLGDQEGTRTVFR